MTNHLTKTLAGRVFNIYNAIPMADRNRDKDWYQRAHDAMRYYGAKYHSSVDIACAVCSALSPAMLWEENVWWTEAVLSQSDRVSGYHYAESPMPSYRGYRHAWRKAALIATGVLAPYNAFDPRQAPKTFNFYHNLLDPCSPDYVTIDRHAMAAIYPLRTKSDAIRGKEYQAAANVYKDAARTLGLVPCQLQSIIWVAQRKKGLANEQ